MEQACRLLTSAFLWTALSVMFTKLPLSFAANLVLWRWTKAGGEASVATQRQRRGGAGAGMGGAGVRERSAGGERLVGVLVGELSAVTKLTGDSIACVVELLARVDTRCTSNASPRTWEVVKVCWEELWLEAAGDGGLDGRGYS